MTEANLGDGIFPAAEFVRAGGAFAIGSDSNVLISAAQELRLLEYGQRLVRHERNSLASGPGRSTGTSLWSAAGRGGARALGGTACGIAPGAPADIISLRADDPGLAGGDGDRLLDGWIFAARADRVDCVWRAGAKVVADGVHRSRAAIERRYRDAMREILQ